MKRTITSVFAIMLALVIVLSLAACGDGGNDSGNSYGVSSNITKTDTSSSKKSIIALSIYDSEIDSRIKDAIVGEVRREYSKADPTSTTYRIANRQINGENIDVFGTLTLYDIYGKITTGRLDGSGSYTKSFEVTVKPEKSFIYDTCIIKEK